MRLVVIGASSAGSSICETARLLDPFADITLITAERVPMYSRCLLPRYIIGERSRDELSFRSSDWSDRLGLNVIVNKARRILPLERRVELETGDYIPYDRLAVATGASAIRLSLPGIETRGVFDLYTLASAETIKAWLSNVSRAIVLGAGLIGMKAAAALSGLHKQITVVEQKNTVMPDTLDVRAAVLMAQVLEKHGVHVRTDQTICEVMQSGDGSIRGVRLASGEMLECEMLVCAVGVRPNIELLRSAGAETNFGARITDRLETSLPGVFAAGDVAEAPMVNSTRTLRQANWLNSAREGRLAAYNMLGQTTVYAGRLRANAVELFGSPLVSVGDVATGESEELVLDDPSSGTYRKLFLKDGRLAGFIMLGETAEAGVFTTLVQQARRVAPLRDRLLKEGVACLPSASLGMLRKTGREPAPFSRSG